MAFFAFGGVIKLIIDPYTTKGEPVGPFFVIILFFVWIVFLYSIYDNLKIPKITIDNNGILFKTIFSTRKVSWQEISKIDLTDKKNVAFTTNAEEISTLSLITNEKVFLRTECYSNSAPIRQILEKAIPFIESGKNELPINLFETIEQKNIRQQYFENEALWVSKFSGNSLLNFNAIIIIIGFPIGLFLLTRNTISQYPERLPILIIPTIAFYLGFGFQLHYFILSDKYLIIKNNFWFWKRHIYNIEDIKEIVFESPYRTSNSIRVITKNFISKLYPAGSLRIKHWKELKKICRKKCRY